MKTNELKGSFEKLTLQMRVVVLTKFNLTRAKLETEVCALSTSHPIVFSNILIQNYEENNKGR